jgi:hypothetical protein
MSAPGTEPPVLEGAQAPFPFSPQGFCYEPDPSGSGEIQQMEWIHSEHKESHTSQLSLLPHPRCGWLPPKRKPFSF